MLLYLQKQTKTKYESEVKTMKNTIETNEVTIACYNEKDMFYNVSQMKRYGYIKTNDCMWVLIFEKGNSRVILIREF